MKEEHVRRLMDIVKKSAQANFITQEESNRLLAALVASPVPKKKKLVSPKKVT